MPTKKIDISKVTLGAGQTGNSVTMYGGNDTVIGSPDNGVIDDGVIIQNYFQGGDFVIERIAGSDGIPYLLNSQVIPFFQV